MEFTTFKALNRYKWYESTSVSKYSKRSSANTDPLSSAQLKYFIYSPDVKEGTTTSQTRALRARLYELGFLADQWGGKGESGWYNNDVLNAVKKFQEKYQKYFPGMKVTGLMDQVTLNALCSIKV